MTVPLAATRQPNKAQGKRSAALGKRSQKSIEALLGRPQFRRTSDRARANRIRRPFLAPATDQAAPAATEFTRLSTRTVGSCT